MIAFACPSCGTQVQAPDSLAGRQAKCAKCGQPVTVPAGAGSAAWWKDGPAEQPEAPPHDIDVEPVGFTAGSPAPAPPLARTLPAPVEEPLRYNCPRCSTRLESPRSQAGQKLACPGCNQRLQVPRPAAAASPLNKTVLGVESRAAAPQPQYQMPAEALGPASIGQPETPQVHVHLQGSSQPTASDPFGIISLIFGVLALVCVLLAAASLFFVPTRGFEGGVIAGAFILIFGVFAAGPFALIGAGLALFGKGNLRVASLTMNLIALMPTLVIGGLWVYTSIQEHRQQVAEERAERQRRDREEAALRQAAAEARAQEEKQRQAEAEAREEEAKRKHELEVLDARRKAAEAQAQLEKEQAEIRARERADREERERVRAELERQRKEAQEAQEAREKAQRAAEEARQKREAWEKSPEGQAQLKREAEAAKKLADEQARRAKTLADERARRERAELLQAQEEQAAKQLKLARSHYKLGSPEKACQRLREIIRDYPETAAALVARELLKEWDN